MHQSNSRSTRAKRICFTALACLSLILLLSQCSTISNTKSSRVVVSVKEQKLALYKEGKVVKKYPISTSKFGEGDKPGSYKTPLGTMKVAKKIGHKAPKGSVFKSRQRTGEILKPNAPGRDPIVSRIIWLSGTETRNQHAYKRYIYIHGTAEEKKIGQLASYGCIRMSSRDVINLFKRIEHGTEVEVIRGSLPGSLIQATLAPVAAVATAIGHADQQSPAQRVPSHPALRKDRHTQTLVVNSNGGSSWVTPASNLGQ